MQMLRDKTRQQHAAIENVIRLDASFTLQRYAATLQASDSFLLVWEAMAAAGSSRTATAFADPGELEAPEG